MAHHGLCLQMEVPHHGIRLPTAQHSDLLVIDISAQEGSSAACTERASRYITGEETKVRAQSVDRGAERVSDVFRRDRISAVVNVAVIGG